MVIDDSRRIINDLFFDRGAAEAPVGRAFNADIGWPWRANQACDGTTAYLPEVLAGTIEP